MPPMDASRPCANHPELFVAPRSEHSGTPAHHNRVEHARRLCRRCPIRIACRDEGRSTGAEGVWGGEDDRERRECTRFAKAALTVALCGTEDGATLHRHRRERVCGLCRAAERNALQQRKEDRRPGGPRVSERQLDVLAAMAAGISTCAELALAVGSNRQTVNNDRFSLRRELGVDSNEQLVAAATAAGIFAPTPA